MLCHVLLPYALERMIYETYLQLIPSGNLQIILQINSRFDNPKSSLGKLLEGVSAHGSKTIAGWKTSIGSIPLISLNKPHQEDY